MNDVPGEWEKTSIKLFSDLAASNISSAAKAGRNFQNSHSDYEGLILEDIWKKISPRDNQRILDLGCGCGPLADQIIARCKSQGNELTLFDNEAVISQIYDVEKDSTKLFFKSGVFPYDRNLLGSKRFDSIILYSVIQYVTNPKNLIEILIDYLEPGGHLLIGDIPNPDKKRRFLSTKYGEEINTKYQSASNSTVPSKSKAEGGPPVELNDEFILSICGFMRTRGCESFLLPQPSGLPFNNSREDILVVRNYE